MKGGQLLLIIRKNHNIIVIITKMIVPSNIPNPKLADAIAQTIQTSLDSQVAWLQYVYPIVKKGVHSDGLTYPQIYKDGLKDSFDIQPDSTITAYSFLEVVSSYNHNEDNILYNMNLIVWGNLKKIQNVTYDFSSELIKEVVTVLKGLYPAMDLIKESINIFTNYEDVFDYTGITQVNTQYMMKPYFGFRINFDVLAKDCFAPFNCGSGSCVGVDIVNQQGTIIDHVPDGGVYPVLQFSGIDEGDSSTVYTNNIVEI